MKQISEQKVREILTKTQEKIDKYQKLANNYVDNSNFMHYDREYAKAIAEWLKHSQYAQYKILLEVLRWELQN